MPTISRKRARCKCLREINVSRARKLLKETAIMCVQAADTPHENEIAAAIKTLRKMLRLLRSLEVASATLLGLDFPTALWHCQAEALSHIG